MAQITSDEKFPKIYSDLDNKYYAIQCEANDAYITLQRRYVHNASDDPLTEQERIIIALCDRINGGD